MFEVTVSYEGRARFLVDSDSRFDAKDFVEVYAKDLIEENRYFDQHQFNYKVIHSGISPAINDEVVIAVFPEDFDIVLGREYRHVDTKFTGTAHSIEGETVTLLGVDDHDALVRRRVHADKLTEFRR